jgi:acetyl esterase
MMVAGRSARAAPTVHARRHEFAKLMRLAHRHAAVAGVQELEVAGPETPLHVRRYAVAPRTADAVPGIVYFHGGGFVAGSLDTHDGLCRSLANEIRANVLSVAYRLAPEYGFPAAVMDACAATRWIVAHARDLGLDAGRIAVAGDSAGACLAAVVCQEMRRVPNVHLAAQLLLCPITDFGGETPSRRLFSDGYVIDTAMIASDLAHYLRGADARDPLVSPLRAPDLTGLPPAFVHTAEFDPMRDEGAAYAERLARAGVPVEHTCHPGMIHLFFAMASVVPYAAAALRRIGEQMRSALAMSELS